MRVAMNPSVMGSGALAKTAAERILYLRPSFVHPLLPDGGTFLHHSGMTVIAF
jgi:hypothetical protein